MKKIIILPFFILALLTLTASPLYASKNDIKLPPWFVNAVKPIQDSINLIFQKLDNNETRIAGLENISSKQKNVDFELPNQQGTSFYEDRFMMNTPLSDCPPGAICLPNAPVDNNCRWNNAVIDSNTSVRAIAHLSTGDIYGVGTCGEILFKLTNIPPSGTSFETDIYIFWQGTEKHTKQTINVPNRPFSAWRNTNISIHD